jgi:hypothetical protein
MGYQGTLREMSSYEEEEVSVCGLLSWGTRKEHGKGKGKGEHTLPQLARESLSAGQAVLVDTKLL